MNNRASLDTFGNRSWSTDFRNVHKSCSTVHKRVEFVISRFGSSNDFNLLPSLYVVYIGMSRNILQAKKTLKKGILRY